jgi:hypothetical protein
MDLVTETMSSGTNSRVTLGVGGVDLEGGELVRLEAQPLRALASVVGRPRRYRCVLISAGRVRRRDGKPSTWVIDGEAIRAGAQLFAGVSVFVGHPGFLESGRNVRNLAGVTESVVEFIEGELSGVVALYDTEAGALCAALFDQILADRKAGRPVPDVGLSALFWHRTEMVDDDRITTEFTHVESVDVVFGPGTQTAVRAALQAVQAGATIAPEGGMMDEIGTVQTPVGGGDGALPAAASVAPAVQPVAEPGGFGGLTPAQVASLQKSYQQSQDLLVGQCQAFLDAQMTMLTGQLPQASLDHLRKQFGGRVFATSELEAAIGNQRDLVASLTQGGVIRGMGITEGQMMDSLDQITLAYEKLMGLPVDQPVRPLSGIRELYLLLTGDREMRGLFNPEYAQLSYTTSATMAEITRNVLNKVMLAQWVALGEAGYNWWQKVCHLEDFASLQQISWITVNGFGDLSTVTEGSAYAEISWDDARETADFIKKGGFVGLTLEMIDKDDVQAWRAVPRGLATAGIRTLSAAIAALFTDNDGCGPALTDTYYLFDATNHLNLITQPLDPDTWDIAVQTMFKQQEGGSSKRLGIRPKYLLVPVEQEKKGYQVLGSGVEPVSGVFYENVRKMATDNVVTVPEWTDEDNWAAAADPVVAPGIGIGFRFGRVPEIFTVTDPRMGLMFTNDVLPIKVRFFYAVGIVNYRALVKSNCG